MIFIRKILSILNHPILYSFAMKTLGADKNTFFIITNYIKPKSGIELLDLGCGPANILNYLPQDIKYTGLDFNKYYIESAKQKYGSRGVFILGDISDKNLRIKGLYDIVIATGVLHHLPNQSAKKLLIDGYGYLKENGRMVTVDNIFVDNLNLINKVALYLDRGSYIRDKSEYLNLFSIFSNVKCEVIKSELKIPYLHIICEVIKQTCEKNE